MTKLDLTYGIVGNLPLTMKKILHDRRALYAGINENGEYVLLNRGLNSVITIVGASCHITQDYNEDNIPNEAIFEIENPRLKLLSPKDREFAHSILSRRGL